MYMYISGIGTVGFDTRLGLYEDPPKQEALNFIKEVQNIFTLTHKLTFSLSSKIILKYMDTPTFKKFLKSADTILHMGQGFVAKKMRELKDMAEKGIDPSGSTQGVLYAHDVIPENVHTSSMKSFVWTLPPPLPPLPPPPPKKKRSGISALFIFTLSLKKFDF